MSRKKQICQIQTLISLSTQHHIKIINERIQYMRHESCLVHCIEIKTKLPRQKLHPFVGTTTLAYSGIVFLIKASYSIYLNINYLASMHGFCCLHTSTRTFKHRNTHQNSSIILANPPFFCFQLFFTLGCKTTFLFLKFYISKQISMVRQTKSNHLYFGKN